MFYKTFPNYRKMFDFTTPPPPVFNLKNLLYINLKFVFKVFDHVFGHNSVKNAYKTDLFINYP